MKSQKPKIPGILLVLLTAATLPIPARADSCHVGVLAGPSFLNNGYGNQVEIGGHAGCLVDPHFDLGLFGTFESLADPTASGITGMMQTFLAFEAGYHPIGDNPLFVGVKLGLASQGSGNNPAPGSSSNTLSHYFGFGPAIGTLFRLHERFGIGIEGNAILIATPGSFTTALNALASLDILF